METVLVTGGMGVIGSLIGRKLIEGGCRTVLFGRREDRSLIQNIAESVQIVTGDILDFSNLMQIIRTHGVQRIIHAAACLSQQAQQEPYEAARINACGTLNVLEAARLAGIERVVFTSSKAVYKKPETGSTQFCPESIDEDYPREPDTVYGATKLFGEQMGLDYNKIYGLDFIALRFGSTYSFGKLTGRHGFARIPGMIENAARGKPTRISHGGAQKDDMVYSKDAANAAVLACFADKSRHHIYHIGTGKGETLLELAAVLKEFFPKAVIEVGSEPDPSDRGRHFVFDIGRARSELGYTPQFDLKACVKDYITEMVKAGIPVNPALFQSA